MVWDRSSYPPLPQPTLMACALEGLKCPLPPRSSPGHRPDLTHGDSTWHIPPKTRFLTGSSEADSAASLALPSLQGSGQVTEVRAPGMLHLQLCLALHNALHAPNSIRKGGRSSQGCVAQPDSTLVHPVLPDQARHLSLPTKRSPQEEEQSLEMLELPPLASGPVSSQSPLGAQGHTKDIHALWSVSTGAPCELELLTALKADMSNITILVPTHPSAGLQNIYINYGYIYCLCVVGHKQMCLAGGRSPF